MYERFKELRKTLKLSQADFGARIGVSRDTVANIEGGRIELKDVFIMAVKKEFHVSEEWLRTGAGDMYALPEDEVGALVADLVENGDSDFYKLIISVMKKYHALPDKDKAVVDSFINSILDQKDTGA